MSETIRTPKAILDSTPTLEGAGVRLRRVFGFHGASRFDPFLLLDDFRSSKPADYRAGFPWHPHRGIETITYMLEGRVSHGDSMGNKGTIGAGDVQWMTAGSGIIHEEMPEGDNNGRMGGFQLWANLPARDKMMHPRYRDVVASDIPVVRDASGAEIRVIAGEYQGTQGPVRDIVIEPGYFDVTLPPKTLFSHGTPAGHTFIAHVFSGSGTVSPGTPVLHEHQAVLFSQGNSVQFKAGEKGMRFLLISGKPLHEPIAWNGPIVMNTQEELRIAFQEYENGTFLRHT